jgi:hypothetical protein
MNRLKQNAIYGTLDILCEMDGTQKGKQANLSALNKGVNMEKCVLNTLKKYYNIFKKITREIVDFFKKNKIIILILKINFLRELSS